MALETKVTGRIEHLGQIETFGENATESMRIIISTDEKFPNYYELSFYGPKVALSREYAKGDIIEAEISVRGNLSKKDPSKAWMSMNVVMAQKLHGKPQSGAASAHRDHTDKFNDVPF